MDEGLTNAGARVAGALQRLGYVGRCSFDHLVVGDPGGDFDEFGVQRVRIVQIGRRTLFARHFEKAASYQLLGLGSPHLVDRHDEDEAGCGIRRGGDENAVGHALDAVFGTSRENGINLAFRIGGKSIDRDNDRDAVPLNIFDVSVKVAATNDDSFRVFLAEGLLGDTAVHLEGANGGDDYGYGRR